MQEFGVRAARLGTVRRAVSAGLLAARQPLRLATLAKESRTGARTRTRYCQSANPARQSALRSVTHTGSSITLSIAPTAPAIAEPVRRR
jgi:hypothetical protein